ncbi:hypothetical protein C8F04DRAFT_1278809 [Mycena alexandri]|uniref:Uncharacterized protein n=1 Tax=Mycena alexandri TaxID=1745969 RepID=A0AAD6WKX8_9AGAR|nr:hypothetical protein C8F04DRAFT_1278809 [Mycena alexandri]
MSPDRREEIIALMREGDEVVEQLMRGETEIVPRRSTRLRGNIEPRDNEVAGLEAAAEPEIALEWESPPEEDISIFNSRPRVEDPTRPMVTDTEMISAIKLAYPNDKLFARVLNHEKDLAMFTVREGLIYTRNRGGEEVLCVPETRMGEKMLQGSLIEQAHETSPRDFEKDHDLDYEDPHADDLKTKRRGRKVASDDTVEGLTAQLQRLKLDYAIAKDREARAEETKKVSQKEIRELHEMIARNAMEIGTLRTKIDVYLGDIKDLKACLREKAEEIREQAGEIRDLRETIDGLEAENGREGGRKRQRTSDYAGDASTRQSSVSTRSGEGPRATAATKRDEPAVGDVAMEVASTAVSAAKQVIPTGPRARKSGTAGDRARGPPNTFGVDFTPAGPPQPTVAGAPLTFRPTPRWAQHMFEVPPQVANHPLDEHGFPTTAAGWHEQQQLQHSRKVWVPAFNQFYLFAYSRAVPEAQRTEVQELASKHYYMPDWFADTLRAVYEAERGMKNREKFPKLKRLEVGFDPELVAEIIQAKELTLRGCAFTDAFQTLDLRLVRGRTLLDLTSTRPEGKQARTTALESERISLEVQIVTVFASPGLYARRLEALKIAIVPEMHLEPWPTPITVPVDTDDVVQRFAHMGVPIYLVNDALVFARAWLSDRTNVPLGWTVAELDEKLDRSRGVPESAPEYFPRSPYLSWARECYNVLNFEYSSWLHPELHPIPRPPNSEIACRIAQGHGHKVENHNVLRWHNPFVEAPEKVTMRNRVKQNNYPASPFRPRRGQPAPPPVPMRMPGTPLAFANNLQRHAMNTTGFNSSMNTIPPQMLLTHEPIKVSAPPAVPRSEDSLMEDAGLSASIYAPSPIVSPAKSDTRARAQSPEMEDIPSSPTVSETFSEEMERTKAARAELLQPPEDLSALLEGTKGGPVSAGNETMEQMMDAVMDIPAEGIMGGMPSN